MNINRELHTRILLQLLVAFFKDASLASKLAFKGGTCAMLFYALPRISLDLDFDLLHPPTKDDLNTISATAHSYGKIKDSHDKEYTHFFLLDYETNAPNIKLEFNKRVWKNNTYKFTQFMGVPINIQDETTLATNKLVAIMDRAHPASRDVFDAYYFLKMGYPIKETLLKERTGKTVREYIRELIPFLNKTFHQKNILYELSYLLTDEKQRAWVKTKLVSEFIAALEKI